MTTVSDNPVAGAETFRVLALGHDCYANIRSGELVTAARFTDVVIVSDEYGGNWLMPASVFDVAYERSHICSHLHNTPD